MSDQVVKEGFLCPICVQDLGTVTQLQRHFDEAHANEDKAVLNQLKDLFGRARRKLLKNENDGDIVRYEANSQPIEPTSTLPTGHQPSLWEPQDLGQVNNHTDYFRAVRDRKIDRFVVETNKLLIRLDKLVGHDAPTEQSKRKAYEKTVVPWASDSDVPMCITCGRSFNITRRRHHCRLCGGIMCHACSHFMGFSYAKKLTNPAHEYQGGEGFHRSSSTSSLNSMASLEGDMQIRTCIECRNLLERRDQQMEQRNSKPFIVQLYEKMREYIYEAEKWIPKYLEITESLYIGETTYGLAEAQTLRMKILKIYESIESLSKRIAAIGVSSTEMPPPKTLRLQQMIRAYANNFLQENLMGLQSLPSQEDLDKVRKAREMEIKRKAEEEQRLALIREAKRNEELARKTNDLKIRQSLTRTTESPTKQVKSDTVMGNSGWIPIETSQSETSGDPMVQQMNIIKSYIKQARQAQKWDEVNMLEENLKMLQEEYWRQGQETS